MAARRDYTELFGQLGRDVDEVLAAENAERERLLAPKRVRWEAMAQPLRDMLLCELYELRMAGASRDAELKITDYTTFGGYGGSRPMVEAEFVAERYGQRTPKVRVEALDGEGRYHATYTEDGHFYHDLPEGYGIRNAPLDDEAVGSVVEFLMLKLLTIERIAIPAVRPPPSRRRRPGAMAV